MSKLELNTEGTLRLIADYIVESCGEGYGFMVLVFPFGDGPRAANYISNASRSDMIKALREEADKLEANMDIVSNGKTQ